MHYYPICTSLNLTFTNLIFTGPSLMVMKFSPRANDIIIAPPSPMLFFGSTPEDYGPLNLSVGAELTHTINTTKFNPFILNPWMVQQYSKYSAHMPKFGMLHGQNSAGDAASNNETACFCMAFQGNIHYTILSHLSTSSTYHLLTLKILQFSPC